MLGRLINYIKEVIRKMFSKSKYSPVVGSNILLSEDMISMINEWENCLIGKSKTCLDKDIPSLGLENSVCQEFTNVVLSEMDVKIENNDQLNKYFKDAISTLNEEFQQGLGLGSLIIKPLGNEGKVEYITADRIIPLEFDARKRLIKACFVQIKKVSDEVTYYRFEFHMLTKNGLEIQNKAYKGNKNDVGYEIALNSVDEWANLMPQVTYPGMERMDFGYYRNPIPNRIDKSANGVSIFHRAMKSIAKTDIQAARLDWEYKSAERMVFADYTTVKGDKDNGFKLPSDKKRLIVGVDIDEKLDTFNPAMRDQNYINGLNEYLRNVEKDCCLAFGDLSNVNQVEKTATEIKHAKQRKYDMVNAIENNLKECLEDLAYALAFYNAQYNSGFEFCCTFNDSILNDEETERNNDRIDVANGIMSKLSYRMKWYNEDEATARKALEEIQKETPDQLLQ